MFSLPPDTELNLRRMGYDSWVDDLDEHLALILDRFQVTGLRVLSGGVAGLTLLAETLDQEVVVVKTQPTSLQRAVQALTYLADNSFTPQLLNKDEELNAITISYIEGIEVGSDELLLTEAAAILQSWKGIDAQDLCSLREYSQRRIDTTNMRIKTFNKLLACDQLGTRTQDILVSMEELWVPALKLREDLLSGSASDNGFLHCDFAPHNLLRRPNHELAVIDVGGACGDMAYDVSSMALHINVNNYLEAPQRIKELAQTLDVDSQAALIWGVFRAITSSASLCTRRDRLDDAEILTLASRAILKSLEE